MKRYSLLTIAPALALLAVGCSTPTALQTTEYDDMYYSSSDKTVFVQPAATAQVNTTEEATESDAGGGVINPEYSENNAVTNSYDGDEYYDGRTYDPRDNWYQPNYSYVDPYWGSAYAPMTARHYHTAMAFRDPFYNPYVYDPFYYDPFYSSYYSPYHNPYRRGGVSVAIVFGSVWGNPYWGNPYARHYYSSWYPYNSYYNGFYHGYHHGRNQYIYDRQGYVSTRKVQYGPRTDRSSLVTGGNRGASGRPDRGTLSSDNEEQAVRSANTARRGRPSRTGEVNPADGTTREVITTRPGAVDGNSDGRNNRVRPQRGTTPSTDDQQQRAIPAEGVRPARTREESTPARQVPVPVRRETRSQEVRRERPVPVRTAPVRTQERSEVRPAPVRSSSSSSSSGSGSSSENRSGGRPKRGGN